MYRVSQTNVYGYVSLSNALAGDAGASGADDSRKHHPFGFLEAAAERNFMNRAAETR